MFLERYDRFCTGLDTMFDMPDRTKDLLFRYLHQNGGRLSKRKRSKEFSELSEDEVVAVEELYEQRFG
jgi:hypothetical protein